MLIAMTRDFGKIQGLVRGVRGARAAVPWYLEPLTLQAIVLYERRRSSVALISAFDLIDAFDPIRRDLVKISYASLFLDLVDGMTETSDPHPEIFDLLLHALQALAITTDPRSLARSFEAHLLSMSGLLPDGISLHLSPGAKMSLQQILQTPLDRLGRVRLSKAVEAELRGVLESFLIRALDRQLKSRIFLQALSLESPLERVSVHEPA